MGLFDKIVVDPKLIKSINQGLAIGIAKVNQTGKSSVELLHNDIMIKSYDSANTLKIPIDDIEFIAYTKGNFLIEDKIDIGVSGNQLIIQGQGNNENELRNFYENLLKIKNKEKIGVNFIENNEYPTGVQENTQKKDEVEVTSENNLQSKNDEKIDPAEEIRKYHELMKDGIISENEFKEKKEELLKIKYY